MACICRFECYIVYTLDGKEVESAPSITLRTGFSGVVILLYSVYNDVLDYFKVNRMNRRWFIKFAIGDTPAFMAPNYSWFSAKGMKSAA